MRRDRATRVLATVLFVDMTGSTTIASELGDRRWRALQADYHRVIREQLRRYHGSLVDMAGDGFFATFTDQEQAIRCACAITDAVHDLGVEVRSGVHVGQADRVGRTMGGIAVHTGARIMALAGAAEVVVSAVVRDLVSGAGFTYTDLGMHELKGVPDAVHLFRITAVDGVACPASLDADEAQRRRDAIKPTTLVFRGRGKRRATIASAVALVLVTVAALWVATSRSHGLRLTTNSLLRIDPKSGAFLADVPVVPPKGTEFSAVPPTHAVWILSHHFEVISVVDERSNTHAATFGGFGLATHGTGYSLRYGAGSVWVATRDKSIARINPKTRSVANRIPLPVGANLMAFGRGRLWAITYSPNGLFEVYPRTNTAKLVATTRPDVNGITVGQGAVWLTNYGANAVSKINPSTGKTAKIPLGADGVHPSGITYGYRYIWVANSGGGSTPETVSRINPDTNSVHTFSVCRTTSGPVTDLVATDNRIWVTCPDARAVATVDPVTLKVRRITIPGDGHPTEITSAYGSIWVTLEPLYTLAQYAAS